MEQLIDLDRKLFLYLNGFHTPGLDMLMFQMSKTYFWAPLYVWLIYLFIRKYRKHSYIPLLGMAVVITSADRLTSGLMKPFFQRFRPSHEPTLQGLVHTVDGYLGGLYGFASSHAANTFAAAAFFFFLLKDSYRWTGLLFLWAVLVTYTRIYLGVHYPGDVLAGGAIGTLIGWAGATLCEKLSSGRLRSFKTS
jgi:undecaprenyl-diphosphatase